MKGANSMELMIGFVLMIIFALVGLYVGIKTSFIQTLGNPSSGIGAILSMLGGS